MIGGNVLLVWLHVVTDRIYLHEGMLQTSLSPDCSMDGRVCIDSFAEHGMLHLGYSLLDRFISLTEHGTTRISRDDDSPVWRLSKRRVLGLLGRVFLIFGVKSPCTEGVA